MERADQVLSFALAPVMPGAYRSARSTRMLTTSSATIWRPARAPSTDVTGVINATSGLRIMKPVNAVPTPSRLPQPLYLLKQDHLDRAARPVALFPEEHPAGAGR